MAAKALFTFVGDTNPQFTKGQGYPSFDNNGGWRTVDDAGRLAHVNETANEWRLEALNIDGEDVWKRPQDEEKKDGEQSNSTEGRSAAKDEKASGGRPGADKENREGSADARKRG
jgi:hypothetical protein